MPVIAPDAQGIAAAAQLLQASRVVALPTETVYGLAADATSPSAVLSIYTTKGRPQFNPLIVHVQTLQQAERYGTFSPMARSLAEAFWPGPLTLVVPYHTHANIPDIVRAGLPSLALRVPAHPLMQAVLAASGLPLAAPSANRSGHVSATSAAHVLEDFGPDVPVLDGGTCTLGLESTILDCTTPTPTVLRAGALPRETIAQLLGQPLITPKLDDACPKAPGMLLKHYAPQAQVRLNATTVKEGEALLAFGPTNLQAPQMRNLSPTASLAEAALNLFAMLRELDSLGPTAIAVMPIPLQGLGDAITDRLTRAAAGR